MEKVLAGHAFLELLKWVQKTEILGYKTDGVFPNNFRHGMIVSDAVRISITKKRFLNLYEKRGNSLWPGEVKMRRMLLELKDTKFLAEKVSLAIKSMHIEHDRLI